MNIFKTMFSNKSDKVLLVAFVFSILMFVFVQINGLRETGFNYFFGFMLTVIPGIGCVTGFYRMRQWGGYKSVVGKAIFFSSVGLLCWSIGSAIWTSYNLFLNIEIPYPSWADIFYCQVYVWWGIGIVMLANLTAVESNTRKSKEKIYFFCIPVMMAMITYYFIFLQIHGGSINYDDNPLKVFVDVAYPMGEIVILTILILTSGTTFNYLGERLRLPIMIFISGLVINYVADFYFSYVTSVNSNYSGSLSDLMFICSMFALSLGVSNLHPKLLEDNPTPRS